MTELVLVGGPNAGRHLVSDHEIDRHLYTINASGPCKYSYVTTIAGSSGEFVKFYLCDQTTKAESDRLIADAVKTI